MYGDIAEILYSRSVIEERVKELAAHIMGVYRERSMTVAVVLNGAFIFAADLVRHLAEPVEIVFVRSTSYGADTSPQSEPTIGIPAGVEWKDKNVLIVEDIVDTGRTAAAFRAAIEQRGAASIRVCAFIDKPARREIEIQPDFVGFTLETSPFVVGYGLDLGGRYRNLPFVGVLRPECIDANAG